MTTQTKHRIVEPATVDDLDDAVELFRQFCQQSRFHRLPTFDVEHTRALFADLVEAGTLAVLRDENGDVAGIAGGLLGSVFYSPDFMVLTELFWYVKPEHRRGMAGVRLLGVLETRAREAGCQCMCMGTLANDNGHAGRLLERRGYELTEKFYFRELMK